MTQTMTKAQATYQRRLQQAQATMKIMHRLQCATCPSTSGTGDTYFLTFEDGQATECSCPARGQCIHMKALTLLLAFDIHAEVDTLYASIMREEARARVGNAYEVLAATKHQPTYGKCGHLHKNEDDYCGACKSRWY